jgi:protein involved in sex pheromone biosynthesis
MKKFVGILLGLTLLLSGCSTSLQDNNKVVQDNKNKQQNAIIPKYSISSDYYKTILPYKPSTTRGLIVSDIGNRLDIDEFEQGLMRISSDQFPKKDYLYQDGQLLDKSVVQSWIKRKYTPQEYKDNLANLKKSDATATLINDGLNPISSDTVKLSADQQAQKAPIFLNHILEQDYLKKTGNEVKVAGVSIGLAMNSIYYYTEEHGYPRERDIPQSLMLTQGKEMAQQILTRLRSMPQFKDIPITFGIFRQASRDSVVPGSFVVKTDVSGSDSTIGSWDKIDEKYYLFPSAQATADHRDDAMKIMNFKTDIESYFPNYTGVVGKGFYKDNELVDLTIDIPMQFYGKSEVIAFTQYVTGLVMEYFPSYLKVQVNISSVDRPEALIEKDVNADKPYVHIYD